MTKPIHFLSNLKPLRTIAASAALIALMGGAGAFATTAVGAGKKNKKGGQVKVVDDAFMPTKVKIKKGQKVKWTWSNNNLDAHNVTLLSGPSGVSASAFTSKTKTTHYTFTKKFTVAGKYKFYCTIHPFMVTTVTVK